MITNQKLCRSGFTLMELLIVIVVIAVLAAIALPKFGNASTRSREASLRGHLRELRRASESFANDTGAYPAQLSDLTKETAPAAGVDRDGSSRVISAADWHGPYIQTINPDPVSGTDFSYSLTSPTVGRVTSSASGNDSNGQPYSSY